MADLDWADVMAWIVIARADPSSGMATVAGCRFGRMLLESVSESLRRAYLDGQIEQARITREAQDEPGIGPQEFVPHD